MSKNPSLTKQVVNNLNSKMCPGESRHELKSEGKDRKKITSWTTFKTYLKHLIYFVKWVKDNSRAISELGRKPRTLDECKPYCHIWIENINCCLLSEKTKRILIFLNPLVATHAISNFPL